MEQLKIENLSFTYPQRATPALKQVNLNVAKGSFTVLAGPSGCGKTTLLRLLKPALTPNGAIEGSITLAGKPLKDYSLAETTAKIGFVQQIIDQQVVTTKPLAEMAFGMESLGYSDTIIRQRIAEMCGFFGIEEWVNQDTSTLSGGQLQLLNVISAMVTKPEILILDEPTSQLDPLAAENFISMLNRLHREMGTTIIISEQRLNELLPVCDQLIILQDGKLVGQTDQKNIGDWVRQAQPDLAALMPIPAQIWRAVPSDQPCPLTVRQGTDWLSNYASRHPLQPLKLSDEVVEGEEIVHLSHLSFSYQPQLPTIFHHLSYQVKTGSINALLGGNGTGKTTLLKVIAGLLTPQKGKVKINTTTIGYLPQDPQTLFMKDTVKAEMEDMSSDTVALAKMAQTCGLSNYLNSHPYDLSSGEQQRLALAKILLLKPDLLLLDEPTKSLDANYRQVLGRLLEKICADGCTVIMASHDLEFCAKYAKQCAMLFNGEITINIATRSFFTANDFYTTAASRMGRQFIPLALTASDIIQACGQTVKEIDDDHDKPIPMDWPKNDNSTPSVELKTNTAPVKSGAALILITIPLTIFICLKTPGTHQLFIGALAIAIQALAAFYFSFEKRRPSAREIALLAVLCGINVAGRLALAFLPNFKPVMSLTIIAGAAFGGPAGFLVGSMTMLASNALFGQGPWTIWQMFAMGLVGYGGGLLFYRRHPAKTVELGIYGVLAAIVIYGGIMNPASVIMYQTEVNMAMIATSWLTGLPVDIMQAVATVLFLSVLGQPLIRKLQRLKVKYLS